MTQIAHGHQHHHSHAAALEHAAAGHNRRRGDEVRLTLAFSLTALFLVAEVAGGLWTNSLALLADAGHMLNDTVALALAVGALRVARKPPDDARSYGYGRMQVLAAFANGIILLGICLFIFVEAMVRFQSPPRVLSEPMLAIAVAGLLVNLAALQLLRSSDRSSVNIRSAIFHVVGDLLGSVATIVAAGLIYWKGWNLADPILSVVVAGIILKSAISILKESGHILLEGTPRGVSNAKVASSLKAAVPAIEDVHHMHIWSLDSRETMITLHAVLRNGADRETVLAAAQKHLARELGPDVHATIQVEGGICASPKRTTLHGVSC